jgi:hypothetical protein
MVVVVMVVAERSAIMRVLQNQEILRNRRVPRKRKIRLHPVRPNAAKDRRVPAKDHIKRVIIKKAKKVKKAKTKAKAKANTAESDVHRTQIRKLKKVQVQAQAQVQVRAQAAQILKILKILKRPNPAQAQVPVRPATNTKKRRSKIKKFGISNRKKENLLARKNDANARKCVNFHFYWPVIQLETSSLLPNTFFFLSEYFFS